MDALTAEVARLLARLYGLTADAVCPGGWPWAVTLLGVGVGLLPVVGAAVVALWRRRIGSRYTPGRAVGLGAVGVLSAGVAPLLVFGAAGRVFGAAAAGGPVAGLTARQLRSMSAAVCVVGPQGRYLGGSSVATALTADAPLRFGLAVLGLIGMPLVAALFVMLVARLAVRRGPTWPVRLFWLPLLAVALLTASVPAGTAAHLWLGVAAGAFLGIPVVAALGAPSWAVVGREAAAGRLAAVRRDGAGSGRGPSSGSAAAPAGGARPGPAGSGPGRTGAAGDGWSGRLASRFAARAPEPLVVPADRASAAQPPPPAPGTARPAAGAPAGPRGTAVLGAASTGANGTGANGTGAGAAAAGGGAASGASPARFRLVRRLGSGGFGGVWLAHDARFGQTVAVKAAHVRDVDTEERIRREARALAAVRHPNCVRILDLVPAAGDPGLAGLSGMVIVMEYVRGESLGERVRGRGVVDDVTAARIWSSMAGALGAAHACGLLHRDVKPGNVVVDAAGQAHLIDFGIARRTGDATLTATGFVLGTPDFLAPEVAAGGAATVQSDAWQLAATIGYALCGQPPRGDHADAVSGLRAAAVGGPPTHLPTRSAHLPLLRAALDPEPARRPSLPTVVRALDGWLRSAGVRPDGRPAQGSPQAGVGSADGRGR